jgi:hypothetical protein
MSSKTLSAAIVVGVGMALGALPVAQAAAPVVHHPVVSAQAAQALTALNARLNAQAAAYKSAQAQLAAARAVRALDARWNAEARFFGLR